MKIIDEVEIELDILFQNISDNLRVSFGVYDEKEDENQDIKTDESNDKNV